MSIAAKPVSPASKQRFDIERVRADFPILQQKVRGKPLVYLDNAATSQKPRAVIEAISRYYEGTNANIHRGVHFLSEHATEEYEAVRGIAQKFLNAAESREIIFVRGTTEGINLVAQSLATAGRTFKRAMKSKRTSGGASLRRWNRRRKIRSSCANCVTLAFFQEGNRHERLT